MMSRMAKTGLVLIGALALAGCATAPELDARSGTKAFVPEVFFRGRTYAQGEFVNVIDGSRRGVKAVIDGRFDGQVLTLVEDFAYADGEKDRKTWRLERTAPGVYAGTREDVVGKARAWTDGKVVRLEYSVELGGWTVDFSDVLALRDDGSLVNRATVGKWGIRVGRVELFLRRAEGAS